MRLSFAYERVSLPAVRELSRHTVNSRSDRNYKPVPWVTILGHDLWHLRRHALTPIVDVEVRVPPSRADLTRREHAVQPHDRAVRQVQSPAAPPLSSSSLGVGAEGTEHLWSSRRTRGWVPDAQSVEDLTAPLTSAGER
jgi:hypothetical protein